MDNMNRRQYLVDHSDFDGQNGPLKRNELIALGAVCIIGNFAAGIFLIAILPFHQIELSSSIPLISHRLIEYDGMSFGSWTLYLGCFFSLVAVPLTFFLLGRRRFVPTPLAASGTQILRSIGLSFGSFMIVYFCYFIPLRMPSGELVRFAFLLFFPFFPVFSGLCSLALAFPAMQVLTLFRKEKTHE